MKHDPIDSLMHSGLRDGVFPGAVLLVGKGAVVLLLKAYGMADLFSKQPMTRETVFDLASLTKPLATTLAVARLVDAGRLSFDQTVASELSSLAGSDKAGLTVRQLLCHQSGLPAHLLFAPALQKLSRRERKAAVLALLKQAPLETQPGTASQYSDLGFMLLCRLVESMTSRPIDEFLKAEVYDPLNLDDLFFVDLIGEDNRPDKPFAATELCPVRKRLLKGEVHDDNAWFAGGIDGQAGLFGTAEAVFKLLRHLAACFRGVAPRPLFSKKILTEIFLGSGKNPLPLGFDRPSKKNSSAGQYFSDCTVGHLGFTGTSFWLDLESDIYLILLANRVHPSRWNNRLQTFRPRIHDRIMQLLKIESPKSGH
jgi:CubicO group peptidase (beta-lactamase class C family)